MRFSSVFVTGKQSRLRLLAKILPDLSAASEETLDIIRDVNQVSDLLSSLDEARRGQVVSMASAFADLT